MLKRLGRHPDICEVEDLDQKRADEFVWYRRALLLIFSLTLLLAVPQRTAAPADAERAVGFEDVVVVDGLTAVWTRTKSQTAAGSLQDDVHDSIKTELIDDGDLVENLGNGRPCRLWDERIE